jgi:hypothetical protein
MTGFSYFGIPRIDEKQFIDRRSKYRLIGGARRGFGREGASEATCQECQNDELLFGKAGHRL